MVKNLKNLGEVGQLPALLALVLGLLSVGCGVSDSNGRLKMDPGGAGGNSAGGIEMTGGASGEGGEISAAGTSNAPCNPGDLQCAVDGITPEICDANGIWHGDPSGPCGGTTPVCNAGKCAAYRLVNAGIDSFGVRSDPLQLKPGQTTIILKEQTLSAAPRACGMVKSQQICVTGGIR